ncbi:MAG: TolB family protein [Eubacteriales bacterium]
MRLKNGIIAGILGVSFLQGGCFGKKPALLGGGPTGEGNPPAALSDHKTAVKYVSRIDVLKAGLQLDSLNENILISPDGKYAVFSGSKVPKGKALAGTEVEFVSRLVLADLTSGKVKSLDKGQYIRALEWAPDSGRVLYRKDDGLFTANLSERKPVKISDRAYCGSISPDGNLIAYAERGKGIFTVKTDGHDKKQVTGEVDDWYPVWYPDGKNLFYFADRGVALGDGAGRLQGFGRVNVETGKKVTLLPGEKGKYRRAEWIVPGRSLYINKGWDDGFYELIADLDKGKITELGENDGTPYSPAIDRAGGLVYKVRKDRVAGFDTSGQAVRSLTPGKQVKDRSLDNFGYSVSPDGKMLAYLSGETGANPGSRIKGYKVIVVGSDGNHQKELTQDYGDYHQPVWTPDGASVVTVETGKGTARAGRFIIRILKV